MATPDVHDEQRLTAKGRATRDRIVRAAAQLIVTEGLSAANMESVRNAAAVSGSQLAHYFADKSALIRAVIRRQIGVVLDFTGSPILEAWNRLTTSSGGSISTCATCGASDTSARPRTTPSPRS